MLSRGLAGVAFWRPPTKLALIVNPRSICGAIMDKVQTSSLDDLSRIAGPPLTILMNS
jgi:hypothetical protein